MLLVVSNNTVRRWEASRAAAGPEHTRRPSELVAKQRLLEGWTLAGTMKLRGDFEEANKELQRIFRRSLLAGARALPE
jgi:hypothetical protein